jgi:hypothetical protein
VTAMITAVEFPGHSPRRGLTTPGHCDRVIW